MLELKDFVTATLRDIVQGIKAAQEIDGVGEHVAPKGIGGHTFPADSGIVHAARLLSTVVEFDVAVTAETVDAAKGKGEAKVAVFGIGRGGVDVQGEVSTKNTAVSRVQFSVPLILPQSGRQERS